MATPVIAFQRASKGSRAGYKIQAGPDGLVCKVDQRFWNLGEIKEDGSTELDHNIETIVAEIRAILYYVATADLPHH